MPPSRQKPSKTNLKTNIKYQPKFKCSGVVKNTVLWGESTDGHKLHAIVGGSPHKMSS